jgi:hypothetical protein
MVNKARRGTPLMKPVKYPGERHQVNRFDEVGTRRHFL